MVRRHRKSHRKTRRRHRGGYYSFQGAVGTGAPSWGRGSEMGAFTADQINAGAQHGRGRRTRHRRRSHKSRRVRGGGKFGGVSASYQGEGHRGLANFAGTNTRVPPFNGEAALGKFNDGGAHAGNFKSFGGLLPK
jgi:hypothetical protein